MRRARCPASRARGRHASDGSRTGMRRSLVSCVLSVALGAALLVVLLAQANLDPHATTLLLQGIRPLSVAEVTLLFCLYNFLGAEKWRLIDRNLRVPGSRELPRPLYFAFT